MDHVKDIDQQTFGQDVLQRSHEVPVVVDFWAEWCGPCKTLGPALERVADEYGGAFELVKVDVDANQELARQFGIQSIPTVIAFRDGNPVSQFMGAVPESQIRQFVDAILPTELDRAVERARDAALDGDPEGAARIFREVLAEAPDHQEAGTGLASLLIADGDHEEALIVLGKLARTPEVERLEAAARVQNDGTTDLTPLRERVAADPDDMQARLELGRALAAGGEYEPALDLLLEVVRAGDELREPARQAMVDVFGILGAEHPLTASYRRALANALF
ncbi:MAG: thioredoxin [Acidimicrobiia bacterium]|nr:thioredoxin [Acidimicrobiia bacterium]